MHIQWRPEVLAIVVPALLLLPLVSLDASLHAAEIDPASATRGSLGDSLGDLALGTDIGNLSFCLNGGFALLLGALAMLVVRLNSRSSGRRESVSARRTQRNWLSLLPRRL